MSKTEKAIASMELTEEQAVRCRPLAGRCVLRLEKKAEMAGAGVVGSIVVPESARDMGARDTLVAAEVISTQGAKLPVPEYQFDGSAFYTEEPDFYPGDRVLVRLLMQDLNRKIIVTANSRVDAVLGPDAVVGWVGGVTTNKEPQSYTSGGTFTV